VGYSIVDVRDLIDLHLLAMTSPVAAGERLVAAGDFLWFSDMARILRDNLGDRAAKAPKRTIPDFEVRLGAFFNPEMAQLAPSLGVRSKISAAKAERLLGWRSRSAESSILDTADSHIEKGLV
jgi:dihydroflavonol-4-reductase